MYENIGGAKRLYFWHIFISTIYNYIYLVLYSILNFGLDLWSNLLLSYSCVETVHVLKYKLFQSFFFCEIIDNIEQVLVYLQINE